MNSSNERRMNSYKIIFPYQSDRIHIASDEFEAFDKCFEELRETGKNPQIFVVLNLNSNTPYYLQTNNVSNTSGLTNVGNRDICEKDGVNNLNKDMRDDVSEILTNNPDEPIAPFQGSNQTPGDTFINPMRTQDTTITVPSNGEIQNMQKRLEIYERKIDTMGTRINMLEEELIRAKMKVDYMSQLTIGQTNMNNLLNQKSTQLSEDKQKEEDGCFIM